MPAASPRLPGSFQHWPCGPECRHAQPLAGTFGEWLWCQNPDRGGRPVREGHECIHYQATTSTEPVAPLAFRGR